MVKTVECKFCRKTFKSTSILKHLSQTKKDCKLHYSEEELKSMKNDSIKRARYKERKWRTKHSGYYANYRADHYKRNKEILLKEQAEFDAKNRDKIKLRKSTYYQRRRKYKEKFDYQLLKSSYINVGKICGLMKNKSSKMESEYKNMLEKLRMKKIEDKFVQKNLIFIEKEIESTTADILSVIHHTEKEMNSEYDSDAKYDMSVSLFLLIDDVLENIEKFLLILDKDHSKMDKTIKIEYLQRSDSAWKEFKEDRKKAKKAVVIRTHEGVKSYFKNRKKEADEKLQYTSVVDRARENMSYFEEKGVEVDIQQKFRQIKEDISMVQKDLKNETNEVITEVGELICDWTQNTINWKEKENSDREYIKFNFENLICYIKCEQSKLEHRVQVALKVISRDIQIPPLKPFFNEYFYKCDDSNCKCSEFNDWMS